MKQKRKFMVDYSAYGDVVAYAIIELAQSVIDAVDDNWRESFYDIHTPEQIAEHICHNMVDNHLRLSQMDGWADMDDSMARVVDWPEFDFEMYARELK